MFAGGPLGAHAFVDGASVRRPSSPPQPVPRPRGTAAYQPASGWDDALDVSASPASSDATEQFLDCYSEPSSARASFDIGTAMEEMLSGSVTRLSVPQLAAAAAAAAAAAGGRGGGGAPSGSPQEQAVQQVVHQERQRRRAAETAAAELRGQLDEISALLFTSQQRGAAGRMASSHGPGPADLLRGVLAEAAAAQRAAAAAGAAAAAAADDAALVARMVACVCARAAVAADMGADWAAERAVLERRLDQAVRMGQAMLKHHKEHSAEPEPWRQQLLNTAVAVGCSILGAATAVLIIRRAQAA
ncbi:hypothetical protein C2E20_3964 [Micractinium conductrix]|uniref:Uncharacterized protein n=1 Tax=Micractinium conductrix TaxID=554055 RepID=A0A2P6VFD4_9CHLO|nr:hypothetical protein C2E20_3964 [Micractinium conductrix]|eukprot:PSC72800.1 hypothetical protein C2E20_3964 [Micractinium conductrix]